MTAIHIREFDGQIHAEALARLDTSFTTDFVYAVTSDERTLQLTLVSSNTALVKDYRTALNEAICDPGYVLVEGGLVRGFISVALETWHRRLVIRHLYVDRSSRRRGFGRLLMDRAFDCGHCYGALTAWVEVSNLNCPAVEAYRRLGFSICGFDTAYYAGTTAADEFAIFLARPLGEAK